MTIIVFQARKVRVKALVASKIKTTAVRTNIRFMCGAKKGPRLSATPVLLCSCGEMAFRKPNLFAYRADSIEPHPHSGSNSLATRSAGMISKLCIAIYAENIISPSTLIQRVSHQCTHQHLVSRGYGGSLTGDRQLRRSYLRLARFCRENQRRGGREVDIPGVLPSLGCSECAMQTRYAEARSYTTGRQHRTPP